MTGLQRFNFFLLKLEELLLNAQKNPDPAMWLLKNDGRTVLFMLEALSKLYSGLHDEELFDKLKDKFKSLEDALGDTDHYLEAAEGLKENNQISQHEYDQLNFKAIQSSESLNMLLKEKNWLNGKMPEKIRKKLSSVKWLKEKKEIKQIRKYYKSEIETIREFYKETKPFSDLENHVHEFRRKIRWLSIYPHALLGAIQLTDSKKNDETLEKYLTPQVVNSPFNKMPDAATAKWFLLLDRNRFYALSWMISETGRLKDQGLLIMMKNELRNSSPDDNDKPVIDGILHESTKITEAFIKEKQLDQLIYGIGKIRE